MKTKKAIIFGSSGQAEVMAFLLEVDSEYEITAFTSTKDFIDKNEIYGKPFVPFEQIEETYPPSDYEMHIAVGYQNNNKTRERFYHEAKQKGYKLLTYISSKCTNYAKSIGDNCFIFEDNTLQPFVTIGNNCILWSGNHIGHHSEICDNAFISSHVVISGHCKVESYTFVGVNSCLRDGMSISEGCIIGAGSVIVKNTEPNKTYIGYKATILGS